MKMESMTWHVYSNGECVAYCRYAEDAARLLDEGMEVVYGPTGHTVWVDGEEEFYAAMSYDRFAEVVKGRAAEKAYIRELVKAKRKARK